MILHITNHSQTWHQNASALVREALILTAKIELLQLSRKLLAPRVKSDVPVKKKSMRKVSSAELRRDELEASLTLQS